MECGGSLGSWNKSAQCGTAQHSTAQRNTAQHSTASHSGTKHERAQQEHSAVRRRTATVNLRASITKHSAAQRSTHLPARGGVDDALRPVLGQQVAEGVPAAQSIVRHPECIKGFQMVCQNDARRAKHPCLLAYLLMRSCRLRASRSFSRSSRSARSSSLQQRWNSGRR